VQVASYFGRLVTATLINKEYWEVQVKPTYLLHMFWVH